MSSSPGELVELVMPQLGVSIAEGTLVEWLKAVGEQIERDEPVLEISTDKISSGLPSPAAGVLREILIEAGETVPVGTVLALIEPTGARLEAVPEPDPVATGPEAAERPAPAEPQPASSPPLTPVVRRLAAEHGVDLERLTGSGHGGRITKADVLRAAGEAPRGPRPLHSESPYREDQPAAASLPASPAPGGEPLSPMRAQIAAHMRRSLDTAAHCTTVFEVDMSRVELARTRAGLSYLPYVARAVVLALREYPALNATLEDERLTRHEHVNLGIAVSLGEEGLIVPVLERAEEFSAEGLGSRIRELAARARAGTLRPEEVRGGTFTITNPGAFGALIATPIINQPQVAILDLEAVSRRPVAVTLPDGAEAIAIRPMSYLCMSWDHRALDGALAAQFLAAVKRTLEGWPVARPITPAARQPELLADDGVGT